MEVSKNGGTPKSSFLIGCSWIFPYKPSIWIHLGPNIGRMILVNHIPRHLSAAARKTVALHMGWVGDAWGISNGKYSQIIHLKSFYCDFPWWTSHFFGYPRWWKPPFGFSNQGQGSGPWSSIIEFVVNTWVGFPYWRSVMNPLGDGFPTRDGWPQPSVYTHTYIMLWRKHLWVIGFLMDSVPKKHTYVCNTACCNWCCLDVALMNWSQKLEVSAVARV